MSVNGHRRWESILERARARIAARSRTLPPNVADAVEETFETCDGLMRELAASRAEVADLRRALAGLAGDWAELFAAMPTACILTDPTGKVLQSNRAAGDLLNVSSRHLDRRVITHFVEERGRFLTTLSELPSAGDRFSGNFLVRPRERAPLRVDVIAVRCTTGGQPAWLWFFTRSEEPPRGRERARRFQRSPLPPGQCPIDDAPSGAAAPAGEQTPE